MNSSVGLNNLSNREKWIRKTLSNIPSNSRILDAGAGEKKYKLYCSHLKYVSQDFGQYEGVGDGKGLQTGSWDQLQLDIMSDITNIPESDSSFDAIMCIEVLEHLPEPIKAIQEFSRLIKPDGFLILSAPFCSLTHMAPYHYYSGFNQYFFDRFLKENDFTLLECVPNGNYFEYIAQEIHRIPDVASNYSDQTPLNRLDRFGISLVLKTLQKLSDNNRGSEDLLHCGYHIFAQKFGNSNKK